jgi:transglutaminase-like putative cysteine protease
MRMSTALTAVAVAGAAVAGLAIAQTRGGRPILHEELPAPAGAAGSPTIGDTPAGANPTAFSAGDKVLPRPSLEDAAGAGEPVLGKGGFAADRQTTMTPDSNTGPDSTLRYVSVFNPDVLPFKRMSAFDGVADDYTLHVAHKVLTEVPVGGTTDARTRDRFWGDVVIQLRPGMEVPLPSVAPDMRILSYEVKPRIKLAFSKDGADNYFVRSDESSAAGQYRLVFYADADAGYFAPSLPSRRYTPAEVARLAPKELRPAIPPRVLSAARVTLDKLDLDATMDLGVVFNRLVGYFRAFQAGEIRNPTGDIYRDLCDSQAGVCRHRSFAFAITANALGLPTRYVQNEAHAFVEVWFPERHWQRVDLGGAALRMEVSGADDKTLHRPRAEDPFAKPPEYSSQYTQLEGEIRGLTSQQIADKRRGLDQAPPSGAVSGSPGDSGGPSGPDRIAPDPTLPARAPDPKKATPELLVTRADASAYRGDRLRVEGIVRVAGKGLANHQVNVFLAPAGRGGTDSLRVGSALTTADGTFTADVLVPGAVDLKRYDILLASDEDAYYNAALSD